MIGRAPAGLLLVLAVLLGGCDDSADDSGWAMTADPVDPHGLIWATPDGVVRLDDGSTIDTGSELEDYVVAGDGVYFVKATDDGVSGEVFQASPDGVVATGAIADARSLTSSPDGRYLAFIDRETGEKDTFDTPVANAVVVDLDQGEEIVRSADGMGDPDSDVDLLNLYEDSDRPYVFGLTDETAYIATTDGAYAYDLATGDGGQVTERTDDDSDTDWYAELDPDPTTSPSGDWSIQRRYDGRPDRLVPTGGRPVPTSAPYDMWSVTGWLDDTTAIGIAGAESGTVVLTCAVPSGACEPVPGTEDGVKLPAPVVSSGVPIS